MPESPRLIPALGAVAVVVFAAVATAGGGVAAVQTAAPSCPGQAIDEVYHPCDNGTVTDNRTGLIWLREADCLGGPATWQTAMEFVAGIADGACGLSDGSEPGDWRLPSAAEWEAMVAEADGDPGDLDCSPTITNDIRTGCWTQVCFDFDLCSFSDIQPTFYWSSTTSVDDPTYAWSVFLGVGELAILGKGAGVRFWAVRGGQ